MTDPVDLGVIIVTHNSAAYVGALLDDLARVDLGLTREVVIKDNGSSDATIDIVQQYPNVTIVDDRRNVGYAAGINLASRCLGPHHALLILNPDLRLVDGAVLAMWRRLWTYRVAAVTPRIVDEAGVLQHSLRFEPTILRSVVDSVVGAHLPTRPIWLTEGDYDPESYVYPHPVQWATGACLMIRRDAADEVGPWDERYFLYSEEVDLMRRIRESGWQIWFEPTAVVRHAGAGSGSSPDLTALLAVNKVRYAAAVRGPGAASAVWFAGLTNSILRAVEPGHRRAAALLLRPWSWRFGPRVR